MGVTKNHIEKLKFFSEKLRNIIITHADELSEYEFRAILDVMKKITNKISELKEKESESEIVSEQAPAQEFIAQQEIPEPQIPVFEHIEKLKFFSEKLRNIIITHSDELSEYESRAILDVMKKITNKISELKEKESESEIVSEQAPAQEFIAQQEIPEPQIPVFAPNHMAAHIWNLAGGKREIFLEYLRNNPNLAMNALGSNSDQLRQTINYLHQNIPERVPEVQDGIPRSALQSSNIYGFKYDPKNRNLMVRFQEGGMYNYSDVPPMIYEIFRRGAIPAKTEGKNKYGEWWIGKQPSLGAALYEIIKKNGFPYQKVV